MKDRMELFTEVESFWLMVEGELKKLEVCVATPELLNAEVTFDRTTAPTEVFLLANACAQADHFSGWVYMT